MPLFQIRDNLVSLIRPCNFNLEKDLQTLIEANLETIFNCKFVASEFSTGYEHAGRIDSLALSEDGNPVIIEYKKVESSELINQSLYYLSWIKDHRGDFQMAVNKKLGSHVEIDWSDVRVICIAPGYKKYDLHAVQMMGANIELWQYRLFENGAFYFEEVFRKGTSGASIPNKASQGKKIGDQDITITYTFEDHLNKAASHLKDVIVDLRECILNIDEGVEESPKKQYVAYKVTQNFACMEIQKNKILLFLKLNPLEFQDLPTNARDVRSIGHYGTGDVEFTLTSKSDIAAMGEFIRKAWERVGG
ncbi:hypothetical protein Desde_0821 [Desulfitobacterium dehalogenans ATCC 51507]|uniref:DUF5655 domain-containing protein n=1 Tax=Desulfitobacterium dehalogenans (strain ATCC 51507 / DSM 9161 / JW/IU-DC1) TaxID=756499 RepID=I4A5N2_DESDJ|nr:DUF5655 domain-containing protein [Desulfitobacterium dehalogenans]AFL99266.1 hypothetical protein Desde_0821 [Desulfitobacterium dehalogenans ATCC 51507]